MKFIIAQHKEDTQWADALDHVLITKTKDLPNIGREASSYLFYIVSRYPELAGEYIFCQGHPFDHWPNFIQEIQKHRSVGTRFTCDSFGKPNEQDLPIHEIAHELNLPLLETYTFRTGAQFRVHAQQIKEHPLSWYTKALTLSIHVPKAAWVFERLWPYIWDIETGAELPQK